jgi:hypothetical protein
MGLQVEIVERSSVIVVTLTGATDIGALEPLHDALRVAAGDGQAVVLDVRELTHAPTSGGIIDDLGLTAATLKLVARSSTESARPPVSGVEVYPSVHAAIDAIRAEYPTNSHLIAANPAAQSDDLRERFAQMINGCRQLLERVEDSQEGRG